MNQDHFPVIFISIYLQQNLHPLFNRDHNPTQTLDDDASLARALLNRVNAMSLGESVSRCITARPDPKIASRSIQSDPTRALGISQGATLQSRCLYRETRLSLRAKFVKRGA